MFITVIRVPRVASSTLEEFNEYYSINEVTKFSFRPVKLPSTEGRQDNNIRQEFKDLYLRLVSGNKGKVWGSIGKKVWDDVRMNELLQKENIYKGKSR